MTRKYATFNPAAGEYVVVNTLEEATKKAAEFALAFYFQQGFVGLGTLNY